MNKRINFSFIISMIVALIIRALAIVFSAKDIQHSSYTEVAKSVNRVMSKIGEHLNIVFESKWGIARSLSARIERLGAVSTEELIKALDDIYVETGMDFRVVDDEGISYYHNGKQKYWKDYRALPDETFILSSLQFGLKNENFMKYIVPLKEPLVVGDTKIMYTIFAEPLSDLCKDFDTSSYGEGCLSFIIDKHGFFIYENGSNDLMEDCYNFLAYVEKNVTFLYDESFKNFKENIENGISNTVLVEYNGSYYYLSYCDLNMKNWSAIMLVPEHNIQASAKSSTKKIFRSIAIALETAFILFVIGFTYIMSLNIAEFSIVETINTFANLVRPLAKSKNIDLSIHTANYRQEYLGEDEYRISKPCINLETNAIKYTPNGRRADINFKQKFLSDMPNKVRIICTFRDNEIEMNEDLPKVMYNVFSCAKDGYVIKVECSGLGIPISREIVQMMSGTLKRESAWGREITFTATVALEKYRSGEQDKLPNICALVIGRDTASANELENTFKRFDIVADIIKDSSMLDSVFRQNNSYNLTFVNLDVPKNIGINTVRTLRRHFEDDFQAILTDMVVYSEQITLAGVKLAMNKPYFYSTIYQTILGETQENSTYNSTQDEKEKQITMGMNVLVAEDNDLNWEILYELLKINGIKADHVENGKSCVDVLEAANPKQYDAVLMDVRMPVMDGLEATRLIRRLRKDWLRTIPIIAMTADAFPEDIHQCIEAGMEVHLAKPINLSQLLTVLSNIKNKSNY